MDKEAYKRHMYKPSKVSYPAPQVTKLVENELVLTNEIPRVLSDPSDFSINSLLDSGVDPHLNVPEFVEKDSLNTADAVINAMDAVTAKIENDSKSKISEK